MDVFLRKLCLPLGLVGLLAIFSPASPQEPVGVPCDAVDGEFFPALELSELEKEWYSTQLAAAGETTLCDRARGLREAYRFTWLRSFHPPVIVRIERHDSTHRLVAKKLDGRGGYEPGDLVVNRTTEIGPGEWRRFKTLLSAASFWSSTPDDTTEVVGVDGAQWIVEGVRDRTFWANDLWTPGRTPSTKPYKRLGIYLLELAGLLPSDESAIY